MKNSKKTFRPLVYICAPFSGDVELNKSRALKFAEFVYKKGCIPITPHVLFPFLDDSKEEDRESAMFMDIVLLGKANEVWVLGDKVTKGMKRELHISRRRKQKIRFFNDKFEEVDGNANDDI